LIFAPAKINIGLSILGPRPDGYHDIATVFQALDWGDTVSFRRTAGPVEIECDHPGVPMDESNLVARAFRLFQLETGIEGGLAVRIEKRIPPGAGLGGGSSNAAATLIACDLLWRRGLSQIELMNLAAGIGSDVPFFILGGTAYGTGRGEILKPLSWPLIYHALLILPGEAVSTAWAYARIRMTLTNVKKITKLTDILETGDLSALHRDAPNDLESVVFPSHPRLGEIKQALYRHGACYASMSGSGSTIYGLFIKREDAEAAASSLVRDKGIQAHLAKPIPSTIPINGI
jgi:4-diphosphocytidyl-2-C-methyl-D-erythritol kinase